MDSTKEINQYLKRLKNGERCLEDFLRATSGYIKFVAYHYLVDKSFLDDVVNNTFYKIFGKIETFDELQSGKAWISKIAQNEAYTINKRERKHNHVSLDDVDEDIVCTTDDSKRLEFVAALEKAIAKLDEIDRMIVEWRIFDDLIFEEIAKRLNMYVGTVHKRYMRSIKKINDEIL